MLYATLQIFYTDYLHFIGCMVEYYRISRTYFDLTMEPIFNWNVMSHFASSLSTETECNRFRLR